MDRRTDLDTLLDLAHTIEQAPHVQIQTYVKAGSEEVRAAHS